MEEWKDIVGFPGYQVSNVGNVRSYNKVTSSARFKVRHWKNRVIQQKIHHKDHYARVDLWKDGKPYTVLVHRLVAEAFIATDNTKQTINHKDGNKLNNVVDNLEWLSLADNIKHGFVTGLYPTQKSCVLVDTNGNTIPFRSQSEASRFLGRNAGYVNYMIQKGVTILRSTNGNFFTLQVS